MTGYSDKDLQKMNFMFATYENGGLSVSEFGEMLESEAKNAGILFDGKTVEQGVNALLSLLSEEQSMGGISHYIENRRISQAKKAYEDELIAMEEAKDKAFMDEFGMTYEEYTNLENAITASIEDNAEFYNNFRGSQSYADFIITFDKSNNTSYEPERKNNGSHAAGKGTHGNDEPIGNRPADTSGTGTAEGIQTAENAGGSGQSHKDERGTSGADSGTEGDKTSDEISATTGTDKGYVIEKRHHNRLDQDIFAVRFTERFDRDKFLSLKSKAKQYRGYYSRFGKGGFIFESEEAAAKFAKAVVSPEDKASSEIKEASKQVDKGPSEAQKKAGNYKMGHVKVDGYDVTIENPKGSIRSGKDADGKEWSVTMNNTYGYIRGT